MSNEEKIKLLKLEIEYLEKTLAYSRSFGRSLDFNKSNDSDERKNSIKNEELLVSNHR